MSKIIIDKLRKLNVYVQDGASIPNQILLSILENTEEKGSYAEPVEFRNTCRIEEVPALAPGCIIEGIIKEKVSFEPHVTISRSGCVAYSHIGKGCQIHGTVEHSVMGDQVIVHQGSLVSGSKVGTGAVIGGKYGHTPGALVNSHLGRRCQMNGTMVRCHVADEVIFSGHAHESKFGFRALFEDSRAEYSNIGASCMVKHQSYIEESTLEPFYRTIQDTDGKETEHLYPVKVFRATIKQSLIWGGTDINDGCLVRSNTVVGPFVHLGAGSELKAACISGWLPESTVEIPHRNYLGNATAQSFFVYNDHSDKNYFEKVKEKITYLFCGHLLELTTDETVPGGFHEPVKATFGNHGWKQKIALEGINCGALLTTSNFDPRNGGSKWPTIIEAGVKMGIMTMLQAPVIVTRRTLLATGSKMSGRHTPPGSIVLSGIGRSLIKKGHIDDNRGLLGEGVAEKIDISMFYLNLIKAIRLALTDVYRFIYPKSNDAIQYEETLLGNQALEILTWTRRYLQMVPKSRDTLIKRHDAEPTPKLESRIKEHNAVMERFDSLLNEISDLEVYFKTSFVGIEADQ